MKTTLLPALLLYPLLLSAALAQAPFFFPGQNTVRPAPVIPAQPVQRMPYAMPPAMFPQMPYAYPRPQYPYAPPAQATMPGAMLPAATPPQAAIKKPFNEYSGYLGLITDILPSSVIAQLPDGVTQGILFKGFADNSPASNSDLKPYDVIFAYNDSKLNHPAQLIKLIRNDRPGRIARLKVVRKGKILEIPVTLGSQKTPNPKEINGLEIKQFGDDKFRAIIHYLGPNGNKQLRSFEGSREDIFDEVMQAQDLPQAERQQLLYAMRPRQDSKKGFSKFIPFGNNGSKDWKFMDPGKYFKW